MKGLTERQAALLGFIEQYIEKNGYSPSYREIQEAFTFQSIASVHKHLQALVRKGAIVKDPGSSRSLVPIVKEKGAGVSCQISYIGDVSYRFGLETLSSPQTIEIPKFFLPKIEDVYALRVKDDGFQDELLSHGDLLFIESRHYAEPGQTILATLPERKALIKKYNPLEEFVELQSQTKGIHPFFCDPAQLTILGVLVGSSRFY